MKISLQKFSRIAATIILFALAVSTTTAAQSVDYFQYDRPVTFATRPLTFAPSPMNYAPAPMMFAPNNQFVFNNRMRNLDAMFQANSRLPLGGFFAPNFTRTLTLLGGPNFAVADLSGGFTDVTQYSSLNFDQDFVVPANGSLENPTPFAATPVDQDTDDTGYAISFAFGRRHSWTLRSEFEFAVRGNDFSRSFPGFVSSDFSADVTTYSILKNVFFEYPNRSRFTPYGGFGLGISWVDVDGQTTIFSNTTTTSAFSDDDTAFTYQFIGGVSAHLNQSLDFVIEYRFLGTGDIELDSIGSLPYHANNLLFGLKYEY